MDFFLGIDIGSTSINTVVLDSDNKILNEYYDYTFGKPFHKLKDRLTEIFSSIRKKT